MNKKHEIPKPNRRGWHWLRRGSAVRSGDAYQWHSYDPGEIAKATKVDFGVKSTGPDYNDMHDQWGGYIRRNTP